MKKGVVKISRKVKRFRMVKKELDDINTNTSVDTQIYQITKTLNEQI